MFDIFPIARKFPISGTVVSVRSFGRGHINDTLLVECDDGGTVVRYVLQKINTAVFPDPEALMENMVRVTGHLQSAMMPAGRRCLSLISGRNGAPLVRDHAGGYWRLFNFIENTVPVAIMGTDHQAEATGFVFGEFHRLLSNLAPPPLHEVIPDFHNTPLRFQRFCAAVSSDPVNRAMLVNDEIQYLMGRKDDCDVLDAPLRRGEIPLRIIHNDAKIDNVLFDRDSGEPACVVDLDTVMPGIVHWDTGDLIRSGASTVAEDESDGAQVDIRLSIFESLMRGYRNGVGGLLDEREKQLLAIAPLLITLEQSIRFVTDFLLGDVYYAIAYPEHNLVRARNQIALARSIENRLDAMTTIMERLWR